MIAEDNRPSRAAGSKDIRRLKPCGRLLLVAGVSLCAAVLSACAPALGPMPHLSDSAAYATGRSLAAPVVNWPTEQWRRAYGDVQLDVLEAEALQGAPNLRLAQARLRSAEASA